MQTQLDWMKAMLALDRWEAPEGVSWAITRFPGSGRILVLIVACGCTSSELEIEAEPDAATLVGLTTEADRLLVASRARCNCHVKPFVIDTSKMGRDEPDVIACCGCDAEWVGSVAKAAATGWTDIEADDSAGTHWTHAGKCPECSEIKFDLDEPIGLCGEAA